MSNLTRKLRNKTPKSKRGAAPDLAYRIAKQPKPIVGGLSRYAAMAAISAGAEMPKTPEEYAALGLSYQGPLLEDKGQKNGHCNRTACQMPLAGKPQFWMVNHMVTDGRFYYCEKCERDFSKWDRIDRPNAPLRCTADEDNHLYGRGRRAM